MGRRKLEEEAVESFKPVMESKRKIYYASTKGYILSVCRKSYGEKRLKSYKKSNKKFCIVHINRKEYTVSHLIAKAFIPTYKENYCIFYKDGNFMNCAVENLILVPKNQVARVTGAMATSQKVKVTAYDGSVKEYASVRKCAEALNCSYQTVLDKINGKWEKTVLDGYKIEKVNSR